MGKGGITMHTLPTEIDPEEIKREYYAQQQYDEDDLINLTKKFLSENLGGDAPDKWMTADFTFLGPVVGPLNKQQFVKANPVYTIARTFDLNPRHHYFRADPSKPARVFWTTEPLAVHKGSMMGEKPSGKTVKSPPETQSVEFDLSAKGGPKVKKYTVGHVQDVSVGNTGGLGGAYGLFYGIGRPLPYREARPFRKSLFNKLFEILPGFLKPVQFVIYPLFRPFGF